MSHKKYEGKSMSSKKGMSYSKGGKSMDYKKTQVPSDDPWLKVAEKNMGKSFARRT